MGCKISKKNAESFQKGVVQFFEDLILIGAATCVEHVPEKRHVISVVGKHGLMKFYLFAHCEEHRVFSVFRSYDPTTANAGMHLKFNFHEVNQPGMKGEEVAKVFIKDSMRLLLDGTGAKLSAIAEARKNLKIKRKKIA